MLTHSLRLPQTFADKLFAVPHVLADTCVAPAHPQPPPHTQESEEEVEEHYCVVCEKRFRSAGQLSNHERSKKHLEAVAELRQLLEEEEQDADWLVRRAGRTGDAEFRGCVVVLWSCMALMCIAVSCTRSHGIMHAIQ